MTDVSRVGEDHNSQPVNHEPGSRSTDGTDEVNLLDFLILLAKHKLMIASATIAAMIFAVIYALLLPDIYTGTARILPPQQSQSAAASMLGQLSGLAGVAGTSLGIKNSNDLYIGMLKSRTVADQIIGRFNLQALYKPTA